MDGAAAFFFLFSRRFSAFEGSLALLLGCFAKIYGLGRCRLLL
jgi:hypothetical protein